MGRFDGIKKVKLKLRRNTYSKSGKSESGFFGAVVRFILAALLILTVSALDGAGIRAKELFRQNYIVEYAQD